MNGIVVLRLVFSVHILYLGKLLSFLQLGFLIIIIFLLLLIFYFLFYFKQNYQTDKASLLAKVVQRVKELKQQTSELTELESFPSETDEITVLSSDDYSSDGRIIFKASLCCEDRTDLLPDLIEILKSLHLKTLRAEMATLGGRIRNVLIVAADKDHTIESVHFLQNALKSLLERSNASERSKRRRVLDRTLVL